MSEQPQDLTPTMQELMAQMAQMRAELNELKARAAAVVTPLAPQPQPAQEAIRPVVSTTRRKVLRRLAGGLIAGLAVGGAAAVALPQPAQARFIASQGCGAFVTLPGFTANGSLPATTNYGLFATTDASVNLSGGSADTKIGVLGIATTPGTNVFGLYGKGGWYGVYGQGTEFGVYGNGSTYGVYAKSGQYGLGVYSEGYRGVEAHGGDIGVMGIAGNWGVYGNSASGTALYGWTSTGVPLHLEPTSQPTTGTRSKGDMYVDTSGNLHIYNGSQWRTVTTTAG